MPEPTLRRKGFYSCPCVAELRGRTETELQRIADFTVGRHGFGSITWKGEVDVRDLELDELVTIGHGFVSLVDDSRSQRLNRPARVTVANVFACEKSRLPGLPVESTWSLEQRLEAYCESAEISLVSVDAKQGTWVFDVPHFSRYGFLDDDDDHEDASGDQARMQIAGRPDKTLRPRGGADISNTADTSVASRGKSVTPSRVLSVPDDDWSDIADDSFQAKDGAMSERPLDDLEEESKVPALGGGAQFSLFRGLEAPKLQRMQASLFMHDRPTLEAAAAAGAARAEAVDWAVEDSAVSTDTEMESRRVKARPSPRKYGTKTPRLNKAVFDEASTEERVLVRPEEICTTQRIGRKAAPLSAVTTFTPLERSIASGEVGANRDPMLAMGRSFRVCFSGDGRITSLRLPEKAGESFGLKVLDMGYRQRRPCYEDALQVHFQAWKGELDRSVAVEGPRSPSLEMAFGSNIAVRDEGLQQLADISADQGDSHLEVLFRLLHALYGNQDAFREEVIRQRLSAWLSDFACAWSQDEPPAEDYLERVVGLLSSGLVDEAADVAVSNGALRLALMISRSLEFPGTALRNDVRMFTEEFIEGNKGSEDVQSMIDVLKLLSGDVAAVSALHRLSWYRVLGLFLWYDSQGRTSLSIHDAISAYARTWSSDGAAAPAPVPPYAAELPRERKRVLTKGGELDAAYRILCLHTGVSHELGVERTFSTFSSGQARNYMDYRASWLLFQALSGIVGAGARVRREIRIHAAFAQQLEACGLYLWSMYVLAACPPGPERDAALRRQLWRTWPALVRDSVATSEETTLTLEEFLVGELQFPRPWLVEARALDARYRLATTDEAEALCELGKLPDCIEARTEAHQLLCESVTPRIVAAAVRVGTGWEPAARRLLELLTACSHQGLPAWDVMGGVVLTFLTFVVGEKAELQRLWNDGAYIHSFMSRVSHFRCKDGTTSQFLRFIMANLGASLERRLYLHKWSRDGSIAAAAWDQVARSDLVSATLSHSHALQLAGEYAGDDKLGVPANRRWSIPTLDGSGVRLSL